MEARMMIRGTGWRWLASTTAALCLIGAAAGADDAAMEAKRKAEVGIPAGTVLGKDNAALAEGLMPAEILEYYKKGEFTNKVVDWPVGQYKWDPEFLAANKQNVENLSVDADGGIVDKKTNKYPEYIYGYPFPTIDPKDPNAGVKIVWNQAYILYAHLTSAHYYTDMAFLTRTETDRVLRVKVWFNYFDGQKKKLIPEKNPNQMLMQYIAAVESPQDVYGTTALTWRFKAKDKRDMTWTYVPALRRIREVSPANRSDGFLGSDISQDDGPFFDGKPSDFTWKLVGEGEQLRFADPYSLKGEVARDKSPEGGLRELLKKDAPVFGLQDPNWKGIAWAPVTDVLAKRPVWIVEGVPKDRYYLYGKIQLMIDKESFQGAWNRKYSWQGELLHDYVPTGFNSVEWKDPDGTVDSFWGGAVAYFCGINFKLDRATAISFPPGTYLERRIKYPDNFFDYQSLYRFGK
jgi:uncharacterized protein DUF1329